MEDPRVILSTALMVGCVLLVMYAEFILDRKFRKEQRARAKKHLEEQRGYVWAKNSHLRGATLESLRCASSEYLYSQTENFDAGIRNYLEEVTKELK